ncbi:MAG: ATPase, partial [Bacteroidota bacterium]
GAGSSNQELNDRMKLGLKRVFAHADILVDHDLVGAAYAAYDGVPNITCIMGTGSNSCFFDGEQVSEEIPSLAYVIGDEASGSYFGKQLLRAYFYKKLPTELHDSFTEKYNLSKEELIHKVYNEPHSNVYLASFMKFLGDHSDHPLFQKWVEDGIRNFIQIHVKCFKQWENVPVNFIGSVGYYFEDCLRKAAQKEEITVGKIIKKPIYSLVNYHINTILQNNHA